MNPETLLYPIPNKYFPSVKVKKSFHAKVTYRVVGDTVIIDDVCFSPMCLIYIDNTRGLVEEMKVNIQKAENVAIRNNHVPNTIMASLAPFIKY